MAQTSAKLGRPPPEFISRIIRGRRLDRQYHQGRPGGRPRFPPVNWEPAKIDFATIADGSLDATILVRANGDAEMLPGGGPVLGILSIAPYSEMHAHLDHGDMLVLYSDGVTEATNAAYDEFDEERFTEVLRTHRTLPAARIVEAVIKAVTEFAAGAPQADDITLLVAKRL